MKRADIVKLSVLILLVVGGIVLYFTTGLSDLRPEQFREWILNFGIFAGIIFILLYAIAPILLIPGSILSLSAGTIFGPLMGSIYVIIGASIGAIISFFTARYFGHAIQEKLSQAKGLGMDKLEDQFKHRGFFIVLLLRLIPLFPYSILNYALGLTMVPARDYVLGTILGMIPGVFAYVYLGSNIFNVGSPEFYVAIGVFGLFIGVPLLFRQRILAWLHKSHEHP
jgi:uncharacterized membrane protein YdjX (TVP38/TMEM64 family)